MNLLRGLGLRHLGFRVEGLVLRGLGFGIRVRPDYSGQT